MRAVFKKQAIVFLGALFALFVVGSAFSALEGGSDAGVKTDPEKALAISEKDATAGTNNSKDVSEVQSSNSNFNRQSAAQSGSGNS